MQHFLHMLTMWISLQKVGLFIFEVLSTFSTRNPYPHLPLSLPTERREFSSHIINKKKVFGILILNEKTIWMQLTPVVYDDDGEADF